MRTKAAAAALTHEMFLLADFGEERGDAVLLDCALDSAGRVCVLMVDSVPERIDGIFVQTVTRCEHHYSCLVIDEWGTRRFRPAPQRFNYHFFRLLDDGSPLLVGARSRYRSADDVDKNATVFDGESGKVIRRFCLGDGIEDVAVSANGTIWTSYFDEGVLGNYGWNDPVGACGVRSWDSDGMPRYSFDNSDGVIMDCYALNAASDDDVWFYYYTDFKLGHINGEDVGFFEVPVSGSNGFAVSHGRVLFRGGYDDRQAFYLCVNKKGRFGKKRALVPVDGAGRRITIEAFSAAGGAFIVVEGNRIYRSSLDDIRAE